MKNSTAVMRLFILGLISLFLTNCASNKHNVNDSVSYKSVNQHYTNVNSSANILYNYTLSKKYSLSKEDKEKQRDTVFYVLNNLDEGKVAKWYNEEKESWGAVKAKRGPLTNFVYFQGIQLRRNIDAILSGM